MGKRKERRLAAQSNAGRRVKLELFAEPSGDLGGSSTHDEVGGHIDAKHPAGLPNSPSSSAQEHFGDFHIGEQPQNPLLLLGQYSDDELDEESNKRVEHASEDNSLDDHNDQVKGQIVEECENMDVKSTEELSAQNVKKQDLESGPTLLEASHNHESGDAGESGITASGDLLKEMEPAGQISLTGTSDVQVIGDVSSGWKLVMHEESNQYYYWNTETGETSWEVPEVFAGTTKLTYDKKSPYTEETGSSPADMQDHKSAMGIELSASAAAVAVDASVDTGFIPQSREVYRHGLQLDEQMEGYKCEVARQENWDTDVNEGEIRSSSAPFSVLSGDGSSKTVCSEKHINDPGAHDDHKAGFDLYSRLVEQSECLLERLKSLNGSKGYLQGHNQISKYTLEVEIRLSDLKALLPYGSSLLPFWMHCERQLKRLEGSINEFSKSTEMNDAKTTDLSISREKDKSDECMGNEFLTDANENALVYSAPEVAQVPRTSDALAEDSNNDNPYRNVANAERVLSFSSPKRHSDSGTEDGEIIEGTSVSVDTPCPVCHVGEDVDMDVDMEVEDAIPSGRIAENQHQSNPPADFQSLSSDVGFAIPPPPDDEWIPPPPPDHELDPPPPPDSEQVPPPLPDELPETLYPPPPTYMEPAGPPLPYIQHYDFSYSDSTFQYYGNSVSEVTSSNLYLNAGGCPVTVPHAPLYYEAVPNTYSETTPVIVNHVEPVSYYDLQDGRVCPVSVDSSMKSSVYNESAPASYNDRIGCSDAIVEAGPNVKVNDTAFPSAIEMASSGIPASATIQAPATISVKESVSKSSKNSVAPASKVQSKVLRTKKRTVAVAPSLKANKKVSSMVDKWKAAKEELHEDEEDEPENAYEILEKKRQREIEEWRAQQIASGEAKDNANFQPLGGDWRERVKRRRARKAGEAVQSPPKASPTDGNKKPDIVELSKNLPSGWQVYWDESSSQVYYGNTLTSETTWTRPTK